MYCCDKPLSIWVMNILKLENLSVKYGNFYAVKDFSLQVKPGKSIAITGNNGAGKTSVLRGLVGMADTTGRITFRGRDLSRFSGHLLRDGTIGYLPQKNRVFGELTTLENLKIVSQSRSFQEMKNKVLTWFPELEDHLDQRGSNLSGGEQVMLSVGRTLAREPDLLLLDEPTEGLMPDLEERLEKILRRFRGEEGGILLAEQNLNFVEELCSKAYCLQQGRNDKVQKF